MDANEQIDKNAQAIEGLSGFAHTLEETMEDSSKSHASPSCSAYEQQSTMSSQTIKAVDYIVDESKIEELSKSNTAIHKISTSLAERAHFRDMNALDSNLRS